MVVVVMVVGGRPDTFHIQSFFNYEMAQHNRPSSVPFKAAQRTAVAN